MKTNSEMGTGATPNYLNLSSSVKDFSDQQGTAVVGNFLDISKNLQYVKDILPLKVENNIPNQVPDEKGEID